MEWWNVNFMFILSLKYIERCCLFIYLFVSFEIEKVNASSCRIVLHFTSFLFHQIKEKYKKEKKNIKGKSSTTIPSIPHSISFIHYLHSISNLNYTIHSHKKTISHPIPYSIYPSLQIPFVTSNNPPIYPFAKREWKNEQRMRVLDNQSNRITEQVHQD